MKIRTILLSLVFVVSTLSFSRDADAAPGFSLIKFGANTTTFSVPYEGIITGGPSMTILDMIQIDAGIAPLEYIFAKSIGYTDFMWGTSARVRLPWIKVSPMIGAAYSRRHLNAEKSATYGFRRTVDTYLNPFAGIDIRITSDAVLCLGVQLILKKENGVFRKPQSNAEGILADIGAAPFLQMSYMFF